MTHYESTEHSIPQLEIVKLCSLICVDGTQPLRAHHAKSPSMFCAAVTTLNLPPQHRSTFAGSLLSWWMVGPGPKDAQPYLDILLET